MAVTSVLIDPIRAISMQARIGEALIDIILAVLSICARETAAPISRCQLLTLTSILAGPVTTLICRTIAKTSGPSRMAIALKRINVIDASAVFAWIVFAVIDVDLTPSAGESGFALSDE